MSAGDNTVIEGRTMSAELEIFLRPIDEMDTSQVVSEVACVAGVDLVHGPSIYQGAAHVGIVDDEVAIELFVGGHRLLDDNDMPFSSHPYELVFRPLDTTMEETQRSMERVYDGLKETGHYSMFAAFDVQYLLRGDVV